jgi:hypothetical protein
MRTGFHTSANATTHELRNAVSSVAMIKTIALSVYRGLYCAFLGVVLVGLLLRQPIGESLRPFEHPLFYAFIGSIAFAIFSAMAFRRIPERLIWCATLLLSALFVWYGWFSQGAPFVLHELHTFDLSESAKEIRSFRNGSLVGTATLLGFFVCLPVFHHLVGGRKPHL